MTKTLGSSLLALVVVCAPALARADPFSITSTVSTTGMFRCHDFAICIGGGSSITLPSGSGSATITYTGFTTTFDVTTTVSTVPLGRFDVTATEGYVFPANTANPQEQSIIDFVLTAFNPSNLSDTTRLSWAFGPGGRLTLAQRGPWNFTVPPSEDPFPYGGISFTTNSPVLAPNASTLVTADAALVPEPSTLLLLGSGLVGAALRRRRALRG
jgi:hypothetical protein